MEFSHFVILLLIVFFVPYVSPIVWLFSLDTSKESAAGSNAESTEAKERTDERPFKAYLIAECVSLLFVVGTAFFIASYGSYFGFIDTTKLSGDAIKDKVWIWQTFRIFESVVGVTLGVILLRLKANKILSGLCIVYGVSVPSWIQVLYSVIIEPSSMR